MSHDSTLIVIGLIGLFLEALVILAGAIWAVSKINTAGSSLQTTIDHHTQVLSKMDGVLEKVIQRLDTHGERLAKIEGRIHQIPIK